MQYQTGPPGVGQVVVVCTPPFSQQLLRVADDLQLDLQLVALGAHPRQLRTYLVAFPPHALKGSATVIAVPVLAGLRRLALVRVVAHRTLLVVARKHLVLPVSHDIGTDPQLLADLPTRPGARGILDHRLATRPRIHGSPPDPALARLQLVDPARQQRLARIAQRADRARRAPPMPQVMIDRRTLLPGRVALPAPVAKRAAVVAAGLDPCPMPAHQHLPGRTPPARRSPTPRCDRTARTTSPHEASAPSCTSPSVDSFPTKESKKSAPPQFDKFPQRVFLSWTILLQKGQVCRNGLK